MTAPQRVDQQDAVSVHTATVTDDRPTASSSPDQGSDRDQAAALQDRKRARVIAVTSGKGGVGKTNIAVNLCIQLSRMGHRTVLLDADMGTANADVVCGVNPSHNLSHLLKNKRLRVRDIVVDAPGGFKLIPGANGVGEIANLPPAARNHLIRRMSAVEYACDTMVIDTGAGISHLVMAFTIVANTVIVVVTPEPPSITDAYGLIKVLLRHKPDADVAVLVNQAEDSVAAKQVYERIATVTRRFLGCHIGYAGWIPYDRSVRVAVQARRPFVLDRPNCLAGQAMMRLSHSLVAQAERDEQPASGQGYFKRLLSLIGIGR